MLDRSKIIKGITHHKLGQCDMSGKICPYWAENDDCSKKMLGDALDLLNGHDEQVRKWLTVIADNQIAFSPNGNENELDMKYKTGIWDGLQMAYEIITGDLSLFAFSKAITKLKGEEWDEDKGVVHGEAGQAESSGV